MLPLCYFIKSNSLVCTTIPACFVHVPHLSNITAQQKGCTMNYSLHSRNRTVAYAISLYKKINKRQGTMIGMIEAEIIIKERHLHTKTGNLPIVCTPPPISVYLFKL